MDEEERKALTAIRALAGLETRHRSFLTHIAAQSDVAINGGTVTVEDDIIIVNSLGVLCTTKRRPVAVNGVPVASEYTFTSSFENEEVAIWRIYLDVQGNIYEDSAFSNRFGDYNGTYIRNNIVLALAGKLLKSNLFAPKA